LAQLLDGVRLAGCDDLIDHLGRLEQTYKRNKRLAPVAFLIERAHGDFVTAIEAILSGFHVVVQDAMRDVMEIEFLLRDFAYEPHRMAEWLEGTDQHRWNRFRPAVLRQRYAARIGIKPEDLPEARDYKAHSLFLHVSPLKGYLGPHGVMTSNDPLLINVCFVEFLEHAGRLVVAAHRLKRLVARHIRGPQGPPRGLKRLDTAYRSAYGLHNIFAAIVEQNAPAPEGDAT
jgi:hypothetical protein